jgi:hypothetical protein
MMNRQSLFLKSSTSLTIRVMFLLLLALSCFHYDYASSQTPPSSEKKRAQFLREAHDNRLNRAKALERMNEDQLAAELRRESLEGSASFNSFAYNVVVLKRGSVFGPTFRSLLTDSDRSSFLLLLALRKISPAEYQKLSADFRVKVLVDALKHAKSFNAWGLPHIAWHEAAQALIDEKDGARAALVALLVVKDSPDAPILGLYSDKARREYHYRLSDYAWALLNEINGQRIVLPKDPATRDRFIEDMAKEHGFPKPDAPRDHVAPAPPERIRVQ